MPTIIAEDDKHAIVDKGNGSVMRIAKTPGTMPILDRLRGDAGVMPSQDDPAETPDSMPSGADDAAAARDTASSAPAPQPAAAPAPGSEAPAAPAPSVPQQPDLAQAGLEMTGEGYQTQKQAIDDQKKAVQQGASAGHAAAAAQVAAISTFQKAQQDQDRTALQDAAVKQKALADYQTNVNAARDKLTQAAAVNPNRLWQGMGFWQKALAGVSMVLSGMGSGATGGPNLAMKEIDDAINRDIKTQEYSRQKLKDDYATTREGAEDMHNAFMDSTQNYLFQKQVRLDSLNTYLQKIQAQYQGSDVGAKAAALQAQLTSQLGSLQQQMGELYLSTIPSVRDIKPEQWKAADFSNRMLQSENDVQDLEKQGFTGAEAQTSALNSRVVPEYLKPENVKRMNQARLNFISAALREDAGRLTPEITARAEKQYFTQAGDSKKVIEQKRLNRRQVILDARAEAGPALRLMPLMQSAPAPAGFTPIGSK